MSIYVLSIYAMVLRTSSCPLWLERGDYLALGATNHVDIATKVKAPLISLIIEHFQLLQDAICGLYIGRRLVVTM